MEFSPFEFVDEFKRLPVFYGIDCEVPTFDRDVGTQPLCNLQVFFMILRNRRLWRMHHHDFPFPVYVTCRSADDHLFANERINAAPSTPITSLTQNGTTSTSYGFSISESRTIHLAIVSASMISIFHRSGG